MMNGIKIWLIIAAVLIVIGAALFTAMLANANWDFRALNTDSFAANTYTTPHTISNISINSTTADISFYLTDSSSARVVCDDLEKAPHRVSFDNGELTIEQRDERKWYDHIGIHLKSPEIKIYLPKGQYGALNIDVVTGDIDIPSGFTFQQITIEGTTCDVELSASVTGSLSIKTTTGDVEIEDAEFGSIALLATTGDVELFNVKSEILYSTGTTGDISLEDVIVEKNLNITRSTGDVKLEDSDAEAIYIEVGTGDVTGNLLTGKIFTAKSSTGRVRVPENSQGGSCVIITTTGNINIDVG